MYKPTVRSSSFDQISAKISLEESLPPRGLSTVLQTFVAFAVLLIVLSNDSQLFAQNVSARISSREAWVGSPIVLQIQVSNATDFNLPEQFEIDGCDVQAAGAPSQSPHITIINGRRSERRSATMQYFITPRREGRYEIPELEISVNGKTKTTQTLQFVATQSETGDLLFVEVEGKKNKVYVGEPLELKLKLWIKPFGDREQRIKLNEGHMWQMISNQTSWGAFADRLQELAENRQRPGGQTVLRKDAEGGEREYYLYEIEATVYPNKPGKIDASDLQVVVNYPQALGRTRDPFDRFFDDSPFSGNSLVKEMMGEGFFSSPFGKRLTVNKSRPVVAEISVDSTEVLAVPTANRPDDYRGAVGQYRIFAEAEPPQVTAGDPITLRIGVVGDGPMELVQAPPLHQIENLTSDFQVTDQSLAGFVQNETKAFVTTIRPRNEDVSQIPPIPFSFFDPNKEAYVTVYTEPISIDVEKAESLAMNAIVSDVRASSPSVDTKRSSLSDLSNSSDSSPQFNLRNDFSTSVLQTNKPSSGRLWLYFAVIPAAICAVIALARVAFSLPAGITAMKSAKSQATKMIDSANEPADLANALREYVAMRTKSDCPTYRHAAGKLREVNVYDVAAEFESLCNKLTNKSTNFYESTTGEKIVKYRHESLILLETMDLAFSDARRKPFGSIHGKNQSGSRTKTATSLIWLALVCTASAGLASEDFTMENLTAIQDEANSAYRAAEELSNSEPAKARELFAKSARRYQLLVDEGVRNDKLFLNIGNAWYRGGEQTKAIVNYHRALWMNPNNTIARRNLLSIEQIRSAGNQEKSKVDELTFDFSDPGKLIASLHSLIGQKPAQLIFVISSVLFWLLLSYKTVRWRSRTLRWAVIPALLALVTGSAIYQLERSRTDLAVVVVDEIELKSGDGEQFQTVVNVKASAGKAVSIVGRRAKWRKIQLPDGQVGWLPEIALEQITL